MPKPKTYDYLSRNPQEIPGGKTWYYEEARVIEIIHNPKFAEFHHIRIPVSMLRRTLSRYDALAKARFTQPKRRKAAKK